MSLPSINRFHIIGLLLLMFVSCSEKNISKTFTSNFNTTEPRTWIGPEYWSNPLQDWQINNGYLECLVSKKNRNVHVLTKKLDTITGDLNMKVSLQLFNFESTEKGVNWVGFSIGSKGKFNDYRDSAIFGKGLNAGVTTNGNLFIGEMPENETINIATQQILQKGANLKVIIEPHENKYEITISILENDTNKVISQFSKGSIAPDKMVGDLVLVSHYNNNSNKKSVSFKNWEFYGNKIKSYSEYTFGPILFSQYTLSRGVLKLTAQMAPVQINEEKVQLQVQEKNTWKTIEEVAIDKDARTAAFKIKQWDTKRDIPFRLVYNIDKKTNIKEVFYWKGTIRKDPIDKEEIVVAGFTGNSDLGFPNTDITNQIKLHDPDILFFSGDQIYESVGGYGAQRFPTDRAMLDYLRKWYIYGWAYRDLLKDRPTVCITDDHDVYHGNIWGENGKYSPTKHRGGSEGQDAGGYMMPAEWVNMVQRTQTSHLPDPYDPTPVEQGIGTYYTDMVYGGISFAILEDRKFKSAPKALMPEAKIKNGWVLNKKYDISINRKIPSAKLLGDRQLLFLDDWVSDWSYQSEMKILLSQTIFANVATLPKEALTGAVIGKLRIMKKGEYPPDDRPVADLDSNGWPQSGRDNAVKTIREGFAFHLAGDQHLGSTIQYGIEEWNDSGFALCVPSISNYWPRRWYPAVEGKNRDFKKPKYTGEFKDGFGNKMTVHAVSNPIFTGKTPSRLYDRATGYGIVRLNKNNRKISLECWPRNANPELGNKEQYEGWPITISQEDNYGRKAKAYLPKINIKGLEKPVIQIIDEKNNEIIYSLRLNRTTFTPKIFDDTISYTIKVGEPDTNTWQVKNKVTPKDANINFIF
ncbi:MAG: alkaline phosphatase D family protein [Flavobacteriaceae bacterium]|nr:alkaline phosphatase D family protein [Flavobacteriaceae bacterium]